MKKEKECHVCEGVGKVYPTPKGKKCFNCNGKGTVMIEEISK